MPNSVKSFLEVDEVVEQILLVFEVFLHQDVAVKDLFHSASLGPETCLFFGEKFFGTGLEAVENNTE